MAPRSGGAGLLPSGRAREGGAQCWCGFSLALPPRGSGLQFLRWLAGARLAWVPAVGCQRLPAEQQEPEERGRSSSREKAEGEWKGP